MTTDPELREFRIFGKRFKARGLVETPERMVLIDPVLPKRFDDTPNDRRPAQHMRWWLRPYIQTETIERLDKFQSDRTDAYADTGREWWATEGRAGWLANYPSGVRYMVRCLDGGAWDRSTQWGCFATLTEALVCVEQGPSWRRSAATLGVRIDEPRLVP